MGIDILFTVFVILFGATLIKAVLGFGESLVAIPLLTLVIGLQVAAPLISIIVALVTVMMMIRNWQNIDVRVIWKLTVAAVIGVLIGTWALNAIPERPITIGLGIILILLGLYYLRRPKITPLVGTRWTIFFGLLSGMFGGAYNMAGAPIIIYGTMQQWRSEDFRSTLQSYFFVVSLTILFSHATSGLWTNQVLQLALLSLPAVLTGFWIGSRIGDHIPREKFETALYIALIVLGIAIIL